MDRLNASWGGGPWHIVPAVPAGSTRRHVRQDKRPGSWLAHLVIDQQLVDRAFAVVHAALHLQHHAMCPTLDYLLWLVCRHLDAQASHVDKNDRNLSHFGVKGPVLLDALVHSLGNVPTARASAREGNWELLSTTAVVHGKLDSPLHEILDVVVQVELKGFARSLDLLGHAQQDAVVAMVLSPIPRLSLLELIQADGLLNQVSATREQSQQELEGLINLKTLKAVISCSSTIASLWRTSHCACTKACTSGEMQVSPGLARGSAMPSCVMGGPPMMYSQR